MSWFLLAFKRYFDINGRSCRSEYWYFFLFSILISFGLMFLDGMIAIYSRKYSIGLLSILFSLASFIPSITVSVRRLHDIGRSGWWYLLWLTGIGALVLAVMAMIDSQEGENEYGPNPKEHMDED